MKSPKKVEKNTRSRPPVRGLEKVQEGSKGSRALQQLRSSPAGDDDDDGDDDVLLVGLGRWVRSYPFRVTRFGVGPPSPYHTLV